MESTEAANSLLLNPFEIQETGTSTDVGVLNAANSLGLDCLFIANREECVADPKAI